MDNDEEKRELDEFKFVREEIRFQHQQLNSRVGAYLASQSFLVTAMIASSRGGAGQPGLKFVSLAALPLIGICISIWILGAIRGAWSRIEEQRKVMEKYQVREKLMAEDPNNQAHERGRFYAFAVPRAFVAFWAIAALCLWLWP
jgi:hypothetical protein